MVKLKKQRRERSTGKRVNNQAQREREREREREPAEPGINPIKILQRNFYATLFSNILIAYSEIFNQSQC